ncbi:MAG: hypothetical protein LC107_10725 [Chitinophagales bacterium]|nr:hypothetical protein [Chitinophagales bacterium]
MFRYQNKVNYNEKQHPLSPLEDGLKYGIPTLQDYHRLLGIRVVIKP